MNPRIEKWRENALNERKTQNMVQMPFRLMNPRKDILNQVLQHFGNESTNSERHKNMVPMPLNVMNPRKNILNGDKCLLKG